MGDDQRPEKIERGKHIEERLVPGPIQVDLEEALEDPPKRPGVAGPLEQAPEQTKKEIVHGQGGPIVGRLAPLPPAPVEDRKVRPFAEEEVPRMEVAVDPGETGRLVVGTPPPRPGRALPPPARAPLAAPPPEPGVVAPDVAGKTVVRGVPPEGLPGQVGGVVVAEAVLRAGARHDKAPGLAVDQTFDLKGQ